MKRLGSALNNGLGSDRRRRDAEERSLAESELRRASCPPSLKADPTAGCVERHPPRPNDVPRPNCDWCKKPFRPRHGTGGTPQRFCSRECGKIFNRERQRTRRRELYAGSTSLPATRQRPQNGALPLEPAVAALASWQTGVLDIANCQRSEFVVALNEGEGAGTRTEIWPADVRAFMDQHVSRWVEDNKDKLTVRAMTVAAPKYDDIQSCVVVLHHSPKHDVRTDSSGRGVPDGTLPRPRGMS